MNPFGSNDDIKDHPLDQRRGPLKAAALGVALTTFFSLTKLLNAEVVSTQARGSCSSLLASPSFNYGLIRQLPPLKQDIAGKCGPASLAIALSYFGIFQIRSLQDIHGIPNEVTNAVYQVGVQINNISSPLDPLGMSILLNSTSSLSATARAYGLNSTFEIASLQQIASYVAHQEVVLIHWQADRSSIESNHWGAIQSIDSNHITLGDPWPTYPSQHILPLPYFASTATSGWPGLFHIVRIWPHR